MGRSRKEIREAIINKQACIKTKNLPAGYGKDAADFVNKCLIRQPSKRLGINGHSEVKKHPYFKDFDWDSLDDKTMKTTFIPDISKNNFDDNHVNVRGWNDTEEIAEHQELLRRHSKKIVFESYYFDSNMLPPPTDKNGTMHQSEPYAEEIIDREIEEINQLSANEEIETANTIGFSSGKKSKLNSVE